MDGSKTTAKDLPIETKCMGIAITIAQIFQKQAYDSKEAKIFDLGEPGATFAAIEKTINLLNEACIENVGMRGSQLILFCRDPSAFFDEPEMYEELQKSIKEIQGHDLVVEGIANAGQVGNAWYLFGYQLKTIMEDENKERLNEWLTNYFGTYYGGTPGGAL